jgi:hypothetical protein
MGIGWLLFGLAIVVIAGVPMVREGSPWGLVGLVAIGGMYIGGWLESWAERIRREDRRDARRQ